MNEFDYFRLKMQRLQRHTIVPRGCTVFSRWDGWCDTFCRSISFSFSSALILPSISLSLKLRLESVLWLLMSWVSRLRWEAVVSFRDSCRGMTQMQEVKLMMQCQPAITPSFCFREMTRIYTTYIFKEHRNLPVPV